MRNVWMLISGLAMIVAIGGATYYYFPNCLPVDLEEPSASVQKAPSTKGRVLVVPIGNPLLTATKDQLEQWVSLYPIRCGEIVFEKIDEKSTNFNFCIGVIRRRVDRDTGTSISRDDVLDTNVEAHWREVMGDK